MQVWVVYAPQARQVEQLALNLPDAATAIDALRCSGLLARFPELDTPDAIVGVWGSQVSLGHVLREFDRVEVYRPLRVDPKVARRERFVKQGARAAGLFVKKRPGAKAGY